MQHVDLTVSVYATGRSYCELYMERYPRNVMVVTCLQRRRNNVTSHIIYETIVYFMLLILYFGFCIGCL